MSADSNIAAPCSDRPDTVPSSCPIARRRIRGAGFPWRRCGASREFRARRAPRERCGRRVKPRSSRARAVSPATSRDDRTLQSRGARRLASIADASVSGPRESASGAPPCRNAGRGASRCRRTRTSPRRRSRRPNRETAACRRGARPRGETAGRPSGTDTPWHRGRGSKSLLVPYDRTGILRTRRARGFSPVSRRGRRRLRRSPSEPWSPAARWSRRKRDSWAAQEALFATKPSPLQGHSSSAGAARGSAFVDDESQP